MIDVILMKNFNIFDFKEFFFLCHFQIIFFLHFTGKSGVQNVPRFAYPETNAFNVQSMCGTSSDLQQRIQEWACQEGREQVDITQCPKSTEKSRVHLIHRFRLNDSKVQHYRKDLTKKRNITLSSIALLPQGADDVQDQHQISQHPVCCSEDEKENGCR